MPWDLRQGPGPEVQGTTLERTLIDSLLYRKQLGSALPLQALKQALREKKVKLGKIVDLAKQLASAKEPQQARKLAVRQISALKKRVEQSRADPKFKGLAEFQRKLRQLRSADSGHLREFSRQLSRGQFDKAAAALRQVT